MLQKFRFQPALICAAGVLWMMSVSASHAQDKPVAGSPNVALANPRMPVPHTKPCTVQLFPRERFGAKGADNRMGSLPHRFHYVPPAGCKGPWAKVVLEASFSVDPGHQYDRTASIWLDGVNLYFGTTQEPSPKFGPSWKIELGLTDYSSLLRKPGEGVVLINNWVDSLRGSYIYASAQLLFYPANARFPAPRAPNDIYPLNAPKHLPANLQTGKSELVRKIEFPRNTTRVYMDLFAQSQFHDEFWYTCLSKKYLDEAATAVAQPAHKGTSQRPIACGGGSYREVEVLIDGQPAGLAPIYPWIYTGGIDPYLWRPTPGVQTLNFVPYRLDLTPFAGLLSDGKPHAVSVRVLGAHHYFSVAAALLVYRDRKARRTGGAVTRNTLQDAPLTPVVTGKLFRRHGGVAGDVRTRAAQSYVIDGYVDTSAGRVRHRVEESLRFANTQTFTAINPHLSREAVEQSAHVSGFSRSEGGSSRVRKLQRSLGYSLSADLLTKSLSHHSEIDTDHVKQAFKQHIEQQQAGLPVYRARVHNTRSTADEVEFRFHKGHFTLSGSHNQASSQSFAFHNSLGACYHAQLKTAGGKVSSFIHGNGCSAGSKPPQWFTHPDGSPDGFGWRAKVERAGRKHWDSNPR